MKLRNSADLSELFTRDLEVRGRPWLEEMCGWLLRAARLCQGDLHLAVLVLLLRRHAESGRAVSASKLAIESSLARETVRRKLTQLQSAGFVSHDADGWRLRDNRTLVAPS